jgi:hypothetical protein
MLCALMTKRLLALVLVCTVGVLALVHAREAPEKAAQKVADAWIPLWDAGDWNGSYKALAEDTRKHVSKADWLDYWNHVRQPLGTLKSRRLANAKYVESLPTLRGLDGAMIQYRSSFDAGVLIETLGMVREKDGNWRVANYLVNQEP